VPKQWTIKRGPIEIKNRDLSSESGLGLPRASCLGKDTDFSVQGAVLCLPRIMVHDSTNPFLSTTMDILLLILSHIDRVHHNYICQSNDIHVLPPCRDHSPPWKGLVLSSHSILDRPHLQWSLSDTIVRAGTALILRWGLQPPTCGRKLPSTPSERCTRRENQ